jgi:Uma2 family endonuclease
MSARAVRLTLEDIRDLLANEAQIELIGGEIVQRAMTSADHGSSQTKLGALLDPLHRKPGGPRGPGGWWFMSEVDIHYPLNGDVYRHDLMGFRRDAHPKKPQGNPLEIRPDWVCEIFPRGKPANTFSESNARNDTVRKQRTLHLHGVPHYWLLDPMRRVLTVLRHAPEGYLAVLVTELDQVVRAEPFTEIEIDLRELLDEE